MMSPEEYSQKLAETLAEMPEELHEFVTSEAWDRGHSSGYEEVLMLARTLVYVLNRALKAYRARVLKDVQSPTPAATPHLHSVSEEPDDSVT